MPLPQNRLAFEKEIDEMEEQLAQLEANLNGQLPGTPEEVRRMRRDLAQLETANLREPETVADRRGCPACRSSADARLCRDDL